MYYSIKEACTVLWSVPNDSRGVDWSIAAGKDQQLAPRVDQQRYLVVNLQ